MSLPLNWAELIYMILKDTLMISNPIDKNEENVEVYVEVTPEYQTKTEQEVRQ